MSSGCPKCKKAVYAMEEVLCNGKKWHKNCLRCLGCNKMLDTASANLHGDEPYCKTCYGRKYGPKGYGFGQGAGVLSTDTGAVPDRADVPLGSEGEQVDGGNSADGGEEQQRVEMRSNAGYRAQTQSYLPQNSTGSNAGGERPASLHVPVGTTPVCPRCGQKVYEAEKSQFIPSYHKNCFKCMSCKRPLDASYGEHDGSIYCKGCYAKLHGPKGVGYGVGAGALSMG